MTEPKISSIGKYRIIELVGEGAMGVVYRAIDPVLERTVAIKVMNESIARQADLRKRFLHEAQAAGSLQHPNVVCIYDLGEADGHLFIAMEFVQGVDLEHLIESGEPLSLQARLDIIIDVLTGLAFAHKRGIVHRDIKPANIRVGEDGRAKIMDFGVAHLASSSMTSTGSILGTPTYMAPEQITEGKTSPATDIFAVGGVLYQILTLMKPFDAPTLQNLFFKIITEKPRPVSELMPDLPPALDRIVNKAMAKEPADRYATALDMANELTNVRSKLSGPSYPASVSLSASVASAIEQSRQSTRIRTRKLAFVGGSTIAGCSRSRDRVVTAAQERFGKIGSAQQSEPPRRPCAGHDCVCCTGADYYDGASQPEFGFFGATAAITAAKRQAGKTLTNFPGRTRGQRRQSAAQARSNNSSCATSGFCRAATDRRSTTGDGPPGVAAASRSFAASRRSAKTGDIAGGSASPHCRRHRAGR